MVEEQWDGENSIPLKPEDLCSHISLQKSAYFEQTDDEVFTCQRVKLSDFSDAHLLILELGDIVGGKPDNGLIRFTVDSSYNRIFHFFRWKFMSIWEEVDGIPTAYSEVSSITTPQETHLRNKNITSAFKGPGTNHIKMELTPTAYISEPDDYAFSGYRAYFD